MPNVTSQVIRLAGALGLFPRHLRAMLIVCLATITCRAEAPKGPSHDTLETRISTATLMISSRQPNARPDELKQSSARRLTRLALREDIFLGGAYPAPNMDAHLVPSRESQTVVTREVLQDPVSDYDLAVDCLNIDGREIACRAANQWLPADILRQRAQTLVQLFCDEREKQRRAAQSLARFLCMQADHQEDIGAASALRAYYTRIALAEQLLLTHESLSLIDGEVQKQQAALEGGLPAGTDLSSFERHRLDIRDNQLQIVFKDRQLRCVLAEIAGLDYAMSEVCHELLEVSEAPLDCECLKQQALVLRKDLQSWIYLCSQVNEETAPIFAQMLGTLVGNWGLPMPKASVVKMLLCPPDFSSLAQNMRYEIGLIIDTHRQWICQAIDEKCAAVKLAYARTDLARQVVTNWESRIEQLEELDAKGNSMPEELALARTELLKARAEEISRRLDARAAEIDLAEATGGIRDRCCQGSPWFLTGCE